MASTIQISDLKLDEIKNSLVNYLKNTDTFKDYDFEGSGIRTLIDLLAYNTFYYGYYCNMMANEMFLDTAKLESSLISLTKPLGYVVTNRASSNCNVKLDNLNTGYNKLSAYSKFKGYAANGSLYYFYNLEEVPLRQVVTAEVTNIETNFFSIYEGTLVERDAIDVKVNDEDPSENQKYILPTLDVDPKTISIETQSQESDGGYEKWINYLTNPNIVVSSDTRVFFIERKKNGYAILFGKQSETGGNSSSLGKQIQEGDSVFITYLTCSGSDANNISNIEIVSDGDDQDIITSSTTTSVLFPSKNGRSSADIEAIRFFAPKTFARQNRLVTKGDYYALIYELGYGQAGNPDEDFIVFGGEEASPPQLGKVFISILDLSTGQDIQDSNTINQLMSIIKENSIVATSPTYLPALDMNMTLKISGSAPGIAATIINQIQHTIRTTLLNKYTTKKYKNNILREEIKDTCRSADSRFVLNDSGIFLTAKIETTVQSGQQKTINFKNKISKNSVVGNVEIIFGDFKLQDVSVENGKLYKYDLSGQIIDAEINYGDVNYETGIITLYENLNVNASCDAIIRARDDDFYGKDEFVVYIKPENLTITITN